MAIDSDDFDIQELADRAGLSVRTVRFYQAEGLLAAPGTRGKASRYGQADLRRLILIKRLQQQRLTLAEVRARVVALDAEGVESELALLGAGRSGAAAYARSVRLGTPSHTGPGGGLRRGAAPQTTTWDRIAISPQIELHIRRPLSRPEQNLVERLVALARTTLTNGEEP